MGWMGWTTQQTRVWMVRDRRAGYGEENGERRESREPQAADPEGVGPAEAVEPAETVEPVERLGPAGRKSAGGESVGLEPDTSGGAWTQDLAPPTALTAPSEDEDDEDDDDARELRMDRVAVLYGEITAATRAFLAAVAECDRHGDWEHAGFGSCAEWLAWRIGVTRNTANEKVRVALALEELPLTSEAMARGELSFSKVRALTRKATPANETELLELARAGSAANLERVLRAWTKLDGADEARREQALHRSRRFSVFPDPEGQGGMYVVKGRLTPEVAAVLMRAVEAASDALFQEARKGRKGEGGEGDAPEPAQLRADAVGLVSERALAAGFQGPDAPISGSRAERYQVMLHVEETTLEQGTAQGGGRSGGTEGHAPGCVGSGRNGSDGRERATEPGGSRGSSGSGPGSNGRRKGSLQPPLSELKDGTRVTAETARRLSCDAARVVVRTNADGTIFDAGRRTRTVPPATRRALEARDRGCRFPGCGLRFTDGHHIVHWADGGPTKLENLVLLCQRHHRRVHEGRFQVCSGADGKIVFFTPRGRALYEVPPAPALPSTADATDPANLAHPTHPTDPVQGPAHPARPADSAHAVQDPAQNPTQNPAQDLIRGNRDRGVVPDGWAAAPRWHRDGDIPWAIEAAAREALDPWDDEAPDPCDPGDPCDDEALDQWDDEDASAEPETPGVGETRTRGPSSPEPVDPRDSITDLMEPEPWGAEAQVAP